MNRIIIFEWLLFGALTVCGASEIRKCKSKDFPTPCPASAKCAELQSNSIDGQCKCINETFTFNPNYKDDNDYCIYVRPNTDDKTINETNEKGTSSPSVASSNINGTIFGETTKPGVHHVIAGILIPIVLVFIVIGIVFVYKKLHITQHLRNIQRSRRSRPFYEDVMLGNNDNDDPPLI